VKFAPHQKPILAGHRLFEQAIAKDEKYAPAHAGLADAYGALRDPIIGQQLSPKEAIPKARDAARKHWLSLSIADGSCKAEPVNIARQHNVAPGTLHSVERSCGHAALPGWVPAYRCGPASCSAARAAPTKPSIVDSWKARMRLERRWAARIGQWSSVRAGGYGEDYSLSRVPAWWDSLSPQSSSAEFLAVRCCEHRQRRCDQRARRWKAAGPNRTGADPVSDAPRSPSAAGPGSVGLSSCPPALGPHSATTGPHVVALPPKRRLG
jgi:hypothetical protein